MLIGFGIGYNGNETPAQAGESPFPAPAEVKFEAGYGADIDDLKRGYLSSDIKELPKYDKVNYNDRWTRPRMPDEDAPSTEETVNNFEFVEKSARTKGIFTRPRIPQER